MGWFDGETKVVAGEYKVTKDVTLTAKWEKFVLGSADFPFEFGKTYECKKKNSEFYHIQFNSDGTAKYEDTVANELLEGYEYNYFVDTDKKAIYCYVNNYYYMGINNIIIGWISSPDEFEKLYNKCLTENGLRELILNNSIIKNEIIFELVDMILGEAPDETAKNEYIASLIDDEIWESFILMYAQMLPEGTSIYDFFGKLKATEKTNVINALSTVQEYQYEIDETTGNTINLKRVIYEEATLKDMLSPTATGELSWGTTTGSKGIRKGKGQSEGQIIGISISNKFIYYLDGDAPEYSIRELKDGYIYIDDNPYIFESYIKAGYKNIINPIPYTETGKGENLIVTITFEGTQYELTYKETQSSRLNFN